MGLYKRPGGKEWLYWFMYEKKRQWGRTGIIDDGRLATKKVAEKIFVKDQNDFVEGKRFGYASAVLLKDLLNDYLKKYCFSQASYTLKEHIAKLAINYFGEKKRAADVTKDDVFNFRRYLMEEKERPIKGNSFNRYLSPISDCYSIAVDDGVLKENPFNSVKKLKFKEKDFSRNRTASDAEIEKLKESASPTLCNLITFALSTGMRRGEIFNLKWADIDVEKRLILVRKNKEGNPYKALYMVDEARDLLKGLTVKGPFVFCNEKGERLKEHGLIKSEFRRLKEKLGIADLRIHDLRHNFGSDLYDDSGDIYATSKALGHKSIKTTSDIYTNRVDKRLIEAMQKKRSYVTKKPVISSEICDTGVTEASTDFEFSRN